MQDQVETGMRMDTVSSESVSHTIDSQVSDAVSSSIMMTSVGQAAPAEEKPKRKDMIKAADDKTLAGILKRAITLSPQDPRRGKVEKKVMREQMVRNRQSFATQTSLVKPSPVPKKPAPVRKESPRKILHERRTILSAELKLITPEDEVAQIVPGVEMEARLIEFYESRKPLKRQHVAMLQAIFRDADDEFFGGKWYEKSELYKFLNKRISIFELLSLLATDK